MPEGKHLVDTHSDLAAKHCEPCHGGTPALAGAELNQFAAQLPEWKVIDSHHLERAFKFPDFVSALAFVNQIGAVAEREGHHPDLTLGWGRVQVVTYTHAIKGLSQSDFILAAKIDQLYPHPVA
jgi:4a-hydroxytetrahydrobiopterin dehydratase